MFTIRTFGYEDSWSVVDRTVVQPVWTIRDDEPLEDVRAGPEIVGKYVFDMKDTFQNQRALMHARQQLLKEASAMGYNVLIREGWSLTMLRRGQSTCRIEITYRGRPARSAMLSGSKTPPFLEYLEK